MNLKDFKVPHIGMRTFKTALSVTIGLYISHLLGLNSPIFVTIASITTMQPSFYETYKSVRLRIFTCVIGVILGFVLGHFSGGPLLAPIVAGFGIILCILILLKWNLSRMISLTVIVFIASFVAETDQLEYGINRLLGTLVGVVVSLLINYLIASPKVGINLSGILEQTYVDVNKITRSLLIGTKKPDLNKLQAEIEQANTYFKLIKNEIRQPLAPVLSLKDVEEVIDEFNEVFILLRMLSSMPDEIPTFSEKNRELIAELFAYDVLADGEMEEIPNIVSNFHIQTLLEKIKSLGEMYKGGLANELK